MKIITVVGARPQFVKAAAVSRAIRDHNSGCRATGNTPIVEIIVHTGQHFDENMSEVFFREMEIPQPDYHLEINSLSHGAMTGRMLEKIEEVLLVERPDYVLVYGDTNSTLAGALAAKKLHIKVAHVEAGLRSFNMRMPEEINRILTDRISDLLCCPTDTAVNNLRKEGFRTAVARDDENYADTTHPLVVKTGDVMQDAMLYYSTRSAEKSTIVSDLALEDGNFALCTIHRAENTDDPNRLRNIFEALVEIGRELPVIMPIHPRTRKYVDALGIVDLNGCRSLKIAPPVGYFDMIELLKKTRMVLTDSGGLQKEAYFFGKPCVTLRDETEWVELVDRGYNLLAGADKGAITSGVKEMLGKQITAGSDLYGSGRASSAIIRCLHDSFGCS
jgi:UDP-GlcNAc3NAcA epimerase